MITAPEVDDDRELTVEELRDVLSRGDIAMSIDDARRAHVALYGDSWRRATLLSRKDWSSVTSKSLGHKFPMARETMPSDEIELLCACIRDGYATMEVSGVPARPYATFTKMDHYVYDRSHGKHEHRAACVHSYRWLSKMFPKADVRIESDYPSGRRYDIGIVAMNIGVECGYTEISKVNAALRSGWTVISVPYHLREGLIAFKFAPVDTDALKKRDTDRREAIWKRMDEETLLRRRLRVAADGHTLRTRIEGGCHRPATESDKNVGRCSVAVTCDGKESPTDRLRRIAETGTYEELQIELGHRAALRVHMLPIPGSPEQLAMATMKKRLGL